MKKEEFNYELPGELIAQKPADKRDQSQLMVLDRQTQSREYKKFSEIIDYLNPGDLLVLNDTKVIPARLLGHKVVDNKESAAVEVVLLNQLGENRWEVLVRPGQKIQAGTQLTFEKGRLIGTVIDRTEAGGRIIDFECDEEFEVLLNEVGYIPLPPYIKVEHQVHADHELAQRYQTVYAKKPGAAAAPTAGLHFTEDLLKKIKEKGVPIAQITLHTGLGTFRPISVENIEDHEMHAEWFDVSRETVDLIQKTKQAGGRVIAVGTTVVRVLESVVKKEGKLKAVSGWTDIFIHPGHRFKCIDGLITNFHLPMSTLLVLVAAFAGKDFILEAYREAIKKKYRFFSFGDGMFVH